MSIGLPLYLIGLGELPLWRWDESLYANAARHMVQYGYWLIPHTSVDFDGGDLGPTPRLVKPPLMSWAQALAMLVFGINEFAVRFPAACAAVGTALLTFFIGRGLSKDAWTGFAAGCALLVLPPVYLGTHGGRDGTSDMLLTLFGSLFVWWTYRSIRDQRYLIPAGITAGLAILTKGFAAGVFAIVVLPLVAAHWRVYLSRRGLIAAAIAAGVGLSWPLYAWYRYGDLFTDMFVGRMFLDRAGGRLHVESGALFDFMNFPYFERMPGYLSWPFLLALIAGAVVLLVGVATRRIADRRLALFVTWWFCAVVLSFAFLGGTYIWYVLPMVTPAAVIIGYGTTLAARWIMDRMEPSLGFPVPPSVVFVGAVVAVVLAGLAFYPSATPPVENAEQRSLGQAVDRATPADAVVYLVTDAPAPNQTINGEHMFVLSFYARRGLERATLPDVNEDDTIHYAVVPGSARPRLTRTHSVIGKAEQSDILVLTLGDTAAP